jgi:hypothetical protein
MTYQEFNALSESGKQETTTTKGKIGAIIRLVLTGLAFFYAFGCALTDVFTKNVGIGKLFTGLIGAFAVAAIVWIVARLCGFMTPAVRFIWENVCSFGLVGFFVKIGLCLGVFLLPMSAFAIGVLQPFAEYMDGKDTLLIRILTVIVPILLTVLFVWLDIRKIQGKSLFNKFLSE